MKKNAFNLNTILTIVLGIILLAAILVRVFMPIVMLPKLDIPNMVVVSLLALVADHYLNAEQNRNYIWIFVLSVLAFGLLPWAAGFVSGVAILKTAFAGGIVFTIVTWMFSSVQERIQSGAKTKMTLIVCALGIYFAAQCFSGMFL